MTPDGDALRIEVLDGPAMDIDTYARIPIAYEVHSIYAVARAGDDWTLVRRRLDTSYIKDYDAISGGSPAEWPARFELARWTMLLARDPAIAGGSVIAFDEPGGVAVLWDIRVEPARRRQGVGSALFAAAERLAHSRGASSLEVETQNVNVAACDFYARQGCVLARVEPDAYPALPDEIRLVWSKRFE